MWLNDKCSYFFQDDHDVLKFLTYSMSAPDAAPVEGAAISEADREKLAKEFDDYQEKLQKQKDEYVAQCFLDLLLITVGVHFSSIA